jgi:hypothetical protein
VQRRPTPPSLQLTIAPEVVDALHRLIAELRMTRVGVTAVREEP